VSWPSVSIGNLCEFENGDRGKNYPGKSSLVEDGIPFVSAGDLNNGEINKTGLSFISDAHFEKLSNGKFQKGDFLFCLRGTLGKNAFVDRDMHGAIASSLIIVRPGTELADGYFKAFLNSAICQRQVIQNMNGIAQPNLSAASLKRFEIPLPPLNEQKRIAKILDKADHLRSLHKNSLDRLNYLGQSIFGEMFGDPFRNERMWDVKKLKELTAVISSGSTPAGGKKVYVEDGIPFLRSQNVWRRKLKLDDVVYIDNATHQKMKKTSLEHGDILITKTGRVNTENSSLGRAAMFLGEDGSANINGHVYLIRLIPRVSSEFVLYIITMPEYREYIRRVCVGGIDKRQINKEHIEEFPIIFPPNVDQQKFLEKFKIIERQTANLNAQLEKLDNLFASLQQRAFLGEL